MRLLVTGAAGFIGLNLLGLLLKDPEVELIINLDKLSYASHSEAVYISDPKYRFIKMDISDPESVNEITKLIDKNQITGILSLASESVHPDSYIHTHLSGGYFETLRIEDLWDNQEGRGININLKGIETIDMEGNTKLMVLSYKNGMGNWYAIKQISRHKYNGKLINLRQKWGEVTVTPNHTVYNALGQLVSPADNPELLPMRKINYHSWVGKHEYLFSRGEKRAKTKLAFKVSGEDGTLQAFLRFLGAFVSEGWTTFNKANGSYITCICQNDKAWIEKLQEDIKCFYDGPSWIIPHKKENFKDVYRLEVSSKAFYYMIRNLCGTDSSNKFIPDFIFNLDKKYWKDFLDILIEGDGSITHYINYDSRRYTTTSKKLISQLALMWSMLNIDFTYGHRINEGYDDSYILTECKSYQDNQGSLDYKELDYDGYVYDISVEEVKNFVIGTGVVVHNSHVDRSIHSPLEFMNNNLGCVTSMIESLRRSKLSPHLVLVSTDEVYGSLEPHEPRFVETDLLRPSSPYSSSKSAGDLLALSYQHTYGLNIVVTRCSNNYGPWQHAEKLIPCAITSLLADRPIPLHGNGTNIRDWIYVKDHCTALLRVLRYGLKGEVYNIGASNELSNLDIVTRICHLMDKDPTKYINFVTDRPGNDLRYGINSDKIRRLGWKPEADFNTQLERTITWHRAVSL
jgi:dTDP-glucose 4,6-dehydratase